MRCAIHTCGWVCWLGVKVSISGERAVGGYNANKTSSRSAPKPPPPSPSSPLRMFWSRICTVSALFHKLNSDPGFSRAPSTWERYIYTYIRHRHHLGLWTCSVSVLFHKRHLCRCFLSRWGKICWRRECQIEIAWQHPPPRMFEAGLVFAVWSKFCFNRCS